MALWYGCDCVVCGLLIEVKFNVGQQILYMCEGIFDVQLQCGVTQQKPEPARWWLLCIASYVALAYPHLTWFFPAVIYVFRVSGREGLCSLLVCVRETVCALVLLTHYTTIMNVFWDLSLNQTVVWTCTTQTAASNTGEMLVVLLPAKRSWLMQLWSW